MKNLIFSCAAAIFLTLVITGCEELDCLVSGDNVHGRILFGANVPLQQGTNLVIQWSTDSFSTPVLAGSVTESNLHGLVTVPFGACIATNTDVQMRAFQDTNGNGTMDAGEAYGLFDGTNGTNAAFVNVRVTKDSQNVVKDYGPADLAIDNP